MRCFLLTFLAAALLFPLTAKATDVEGDVWGTWTRENSPYNVIGELRVPPCSTLVIEPGVLVDFKGYYKFIVDSLATLIAAGTEDDSIYFTCDTLANPGRWHGIRFLYADGNCQISYCRLEHGRVTGTWPDGAGGAILCYYTSPTIAANTISRNQANNGGGIMCYYSSSMISGNTISSNLATAINGKGGGIHCLYSNPTIAYNTIRANTARLGGGGISCQSCSLTTIEHNSIRSNLAGDDFRYTRGGGISCEDCSATVVCNNVISGNAALSYHNTGCLASGGGIWCSNATISRNIVSDNSATAYGYEAGIGYGGGVSCSSSTLTNNIISGNSAWGCAAGPPFARAAGGGVNCENTTVINSTITRNWTGPGYDHGGGISCDRSSTIINTILWGDSAEYDPEIDGDPTVMYCNVQGGWPGPGNIDVDPLFRDPENDDFHLQSLTNPDCGGPGDSPCIDAGDPTIIDTLIECSWGLGSLRSDMGAYGGGDSLETGIAFDQDNPNPGRFSLLQNYPNPFNSATRISYQSPVSSNVKLEIFDVLGRKVATLVDGRQQAGYRSVVWDASGFSSGLYFYKLTAGEFTQTRRMMLVK